MPCNGLPREYWAQFAAIARGLAYAPVADLETLKAQGYDAVIVATGTQVASLMGVTTGVVGGVLRDILCNDVPLVFLKGELYASAAWVGALALIAMQEIGISGIISAWVAMAVVLLLRLLAMRYHLTLPAFRQPNA